MADELKIKINELGAAQTILGTEFVPIDNGVDTLKATLDQVKEHAIGDNNISALGDGSVTGAILAVKSALDGEKSYSKKKVGRIITVGSNNTDYDYTTINDAITAASAVCSTTNRVLIKVYDGVYTESINLHPNPGIDIIGVGYVQIINSTEAYPDGALYTTGEGYFENLYFENRVNDGLTYAVHIEHDSSETRGVTIFKNCQFVNLYYHAMGCGLTANSEVYFIGCKFYSGSTDSQAAAAYFHNRLLDGAATQAIHAWNCIFYGANASVRIDDSLAFAGTSGTSPLVIEFSNCCGSVGSHVLFGTSQATCTSTANGNANLQIQTTSNNNNEPLMALNYDTTGNITFIQGIGITEYGELIVPIPFHTSNVEIQGGNYTVDGSNYVSLNNTPDGTEPYAFKWQGFSTDAGKVAKVGLVVKTK